MKDQVSKESLRPLSSCSNEHETYWCTAANSPRLMKVNPFLMEVLQCNLWPSTLCNLFMDHECVVHGPGMRIFWQCTKWACVPQGWGKAPEAPRMWSDLAHFLGTICNGLGMNTVSSSLPGMPGYPWEDNFCDSRGWSFTPLCHKIRNFVAHWPTLVFPGIPV